MIHYKEYSNNNSKRQWITFVHGAGGSSAIWKKQIPYFSKAFNLLLVDLSGHGYSTSISSQNPNKISFEYLEAKKTEGAELDTFLRMHPDILQVVVDDYHYEYLPLDTGTPTIFLRSPRRTQGPWGTLGALRALGTPWRLPQGTTSPRRLLLCWGTRSSVSASRTRCRLASPS